MRTPLKLSAVAAAAALALTTLTACGGVRGRRPRRQERQDQDHGGRPRQGHLSARETHPAARLFRGRRRPRHPADRTGRCAGHHLARLRRRPGRRRLLRPHPRSPGQGQAGGIGGAARARPRRGRGRLQQGGRRPHLGQGLQGQEARRHRPRLVHRLPDQIPRGQERRADRRVHPGGGRRRPDLPLGPPTGLDPGRDDDGPDGRADRGQEARQGPHRHAHPRGLAEGARRPVPLLQPLHEHRLGEQPQGAPCRSWPAPW